MKDRTAFADWDRAANLFEAFHERAPHGNQVALVGMRGEEYALEVGTLFGLIYKTREERKPYIHRFRTSNRPLLYVSADGKQVYVLKGGYRFTDRGFIG